ncbi:hypothetical protein IJ101_02390 [Candidatus Saccharibacteria bacterium]|nr:hypothetical protein [Candidatus Saccharibacteria bacterium]
MKIYISGISGTGMGPLALMAEEAGIEVFGSDLAEGAIMPELRKAGIEVKIGEQDGEFLREKISEGVEWFVHTSALPEDHAELKVAREAGVRITKRDDLTAYLVEKLNLKMVAVAGTHGKTTTTAMIVWAALRLGLPVSYLVGTTLGFAPSGAYHKGDRFFVYEADEYDRNFLKYHPWLAVIPFVSYDHPDIYPTREEYQKAFEDFKAQSEKVIEKTSSGCKWKNIGEPIYKATDFRLAGEARRIDASLAADAIFEMMTDELEREDGIIEDKIIDTELIVDVLNKFPGVGRRFEKISDGIYSDYAHHPEEIKATIEIALEQAKIDGRKGVIAVYEPHQNTRQHEVMEGYKNVFVGATKVYWLPTYLTRENPDLTVLRPEDFIKTLSNAEIAEPAEMSTELWNEIQKYVNEDYLVLLMTAGPADAWLRKIIQK